MINSWSQQKLIKNWLNYSDKYKDVMLFNRVVSELQNYLTNTESKALNVLDIGCGDGKFTKEIIDHLDNNNHYKVSENFNIYGIDIIQKFLEKYEENIPGSSTYNFDISKVEMNIEELMDIFKSQFDIVLCIFALHNIENIQTSIYNIHKILKTKGLFLSVVVHPEFAVWLKGGNNLKELIHSKKQSEYIFKANYPIVSKDDVGRELNFHVPYYHRTIYQYNKILDQFYTSVYEIIPSKESIKSLKKHFDKTVYSPEIYTSASSLIFSCYKKTSPAVISTNELTSDVFLKHLERNYGHLDIKKESININDDIINSIENGLYNGSSHFKLVKDISRFIGKKVIIIKSGILAAGKSVQDYSKSYEPYYTCPDFIFTEGDIIGDYEVPFNKINRFPEIPDYGVVGRPKVKKDLFMYSEGLKKDPFNPIRLSIPLAETYAKSDFKDLCENKSDYTHLTKHLNNYNSEKTHDEFYFSDQVDLYLLNANDFWDLVLNDGIVQLWYLYQSIIKPKRIPIEDINVQNAQLPTKGLEGEEKIKEKKKIEKKKLENELKILLANIVNYYYYMGIGRVENNKVIIRIPSRYRLFRYKNEFHSKTINSRYLLTIEQVKDRNKYNKLLNEKLKTEGLTGIYVRMECIINSGSGANPVYQKIIIDRELINMTAIIGWLA